MKVANIVKSEIKTYCEDVNRGAKPAAMIPIQNRHIEELRALVKEKGLKVYVKEFYPNWSEFYIYKRDFLLEVIKEISKAPSVTVYDHWVNGKLFGYSDEAIEEYLNEQF